MPDLVPHPHLPFYRFRLGKTQRMSPGAMDWVFLPAFSIPEYLYRGAGRLAGALAEYQNPQVHAPQLLLAREYGGIETNQDLIPLDSLDNPSNIPDITNIAQYIDPKTGQLILPGTVNANNGAEDIQLL